MMNSSPLIVTTLSYRDLLTEMTAHVSIPSTLTATGKAESSSVPGILITCRYNVSILVSGENHQTCLQALRTCEANGIC